MTALQQLLAAYRLGAPFPTYAQLMGLVSGLRALDELLDAYRNGAEFPTYEQLAAIANAPVAA